MHDEGTIPCPSHVGSLALAARLQEGGGVRFAADGKMIPSFFPDLDACRADLRIALQKKGEQFRGKFLDSFRAGVARHRVDRVFHRVGRKNLAVVALDETRFEVAFEKDFHRPLAKIVPVSAALHFYEPDPRLTV